MSTSDLTRPNFGRPYNIRGKKAARSTRNGVIQFFLLAIMTTSWFPSLSTVGGGDSNIFILFPIALIALLLLSRNPFKIFVASQGDGNTMVLVLASIVLMSALAFISTIYALEPVLSFRVISAHFYGLAVLWATSTLPVDERYFSTYLRIFLIGALVSSGIALLTYLVPPLTALTFGDTDRSSALFKHPNQFGIVLSMAIPVMVAFALSARRKLIPVAGVGLLFVGLILSGSKTNLVTSSMLAVLTLFFCFLRSGFFWKAPIRALLMITALVAVGFLGFDVLGALNPRAQLLLSQAATGENIQSWDSRLNLWSMSLELGAANPLTGVGAGQRIGNYNHSHNIVFDYFRTLGAPGLLGLLALIFPVISLCLASIFGRHRKASILQQNLSIGLGLSALGYLFTNQFSDSFGPSTLSIFWIVLAVLFYLRRTISVIKPVDHDAEGTPGYRRSILSKRETMARDGFSRGPSKRTAAVRNTTR